MNQKKPKTKDVNVESVSSQSASPMLFLLSDLGSFPVSDQC